MTTKTSLFNNAAIPGLILGGISIAYLLLNWLLSKSGSSFAGAISFILGVTKIIACIWVFRNMLISFHRTNPDSDTRTVFRLGKLYALLSALVYSAFYLAYTLFIEPDLFKEAFDAASQTGMLDSASIQMMNSMLPQMPTYSFFINLIYCYLFGLILSAIFSRRIVSSNPFKEQ